MEVIEATYPAADEDGDCMKVGVCLAKTPLQRKRPTAKTGRTQAVCYQAVIVLSDIFERERDVWTNVDADISVKTWGLDLLVDA